MFDSAFENGELSDLGENLVAYARLTHPKKQTLAVRISEASDNLAGSLLDGRNPDSLRAGFNIVSLPYSSDADLYWTPDLIIFAGELLNRDMYIRKVCDIAASYFFVRFLDGNTNSRDYLSSYEDCGAEMLYDHLMKEFVSPMVAALHSNQMMIFRTLERRLARFSLGSRFYDDAGSLVKMIEATRPRPDDIAVQSSVASLVSKFREGEDRGGVNESLKGLLA